MVVEMGLWYVPHTCRSSVPLQPYSSAGMEPNWNIKLEMGGLRVAFVLLGLFIVAIPFSFGVPEPCMAVYDEGGVSAILQSPECSHWIQSNQSVPKNQSTKCHDQHISWNVDMQISFPGKYGSEEVNVGVVAVFDGAIGAEASKMASKHLSDYFMVHSVFTSYKFLGEEEHGMVLEGPNEGVELEQHDPNLLSKSRHMRIFKEALLSTVYDIYSTFSKEALERRLFAGSTATIAVLVDGHIIVANVGDSKALLCSENNHSRKEAKGNIMPHLSPMELTKDHSRSRADEIERLVRAGDTGQRWTVRQGRHGANGKFTLPPAIFGLVFLKRAGVISELEVTDWQPLAASDSYLAVATSGIFEKQTPQDVCDLLHSAPRCSLSSQSADCISSMTHEEGSNDNMSVIVVPLRIRDGKNSRRGVLDPPYTKWDRF